MKSLLLALALSCFALPVRAGDQELASDLVFDAKFYLQRWPDVERFFGHNEAQARVHWLGDGISQARESSPVFDLKFYIKTYPDVAAEVAKGNNRSAVQHWLTKGIPEGRQASETFDVKVYAATLRAQQPGITYEQAIHQYMALPAERRRPYLKVAAAPPPSLLDANKPFAVKGKFYVDVDDFVTLYLNGVKLFRATNGMTPSGEVELRPGDRLVAQLKNVAMPRYFRILFVSSDKSQMVNFPHPSFKILPDPESIDFPAAQFTTFPRLAKPIKSAHNPFPYKNQSEPMWGEADICTLGALLTRENFVPLKLQ